MTLALGLLSWEPPQFLDGWGVGVASSLWVLPEVGAGKGPCVTWAILV